MAHTVANFPVCRHAYIHRPVACASKDRESGELERNPLSSDLLSICWEINPTTNERIQVTLTTPKSLDYPPESRHYVRTLALVLWTVVSLDHHADSLQQLFMQIACNNSESEREKQKKKNYQYVNSGVHNRK